MFLCEPTAHVDAGPRLTRVNSGGNPETTAIWIPHQVRNENRIRHFKTAGYQD